MDTAAQAFLQAGAGVVAHTANFAGIASAVIAPAQASRHHEKAADQTHALHKSVNLFCLWLLRRFVCRCSLLDWADLRAWIGRPCTDDRRSAKVIDGRDLRWQETDVMVYADLFGDLCFTEKRLNKQVNYTTKPWIWQKIFTTRALNYRSARALNGKEVMKGKCVYHYWRIQHPYQEKHFQKERLLTKELHEREKELMAEHHVCFFSHLNQKRSFEFLREQHASNMAWWC